MWYIKFGEIHSRKGMIHLFYRLPLSQCKHAYLRTNCRLKCWLVEVLAYLRKLQELIPSLVYLPSNNIIKDITHMIKPYTKNTNNVYNQLYGHQRHQANLSCTKDKCFHLNIKHEATTECGAIFNRGHPLSKTLHCIGMASK